MQVTTDLDGTIAYGTSYNNALTAENSGISADNTYHAIGGGGAEAVNGVDFELLNNGTTPTNFAWMFLLLRINSTITMVVGM